MVSFHMILITVFILSAHSLEVIFESSKITYTNDKYVEGIVWNVRRYSRKGNYHLNVYGTIKQTWTNNVSISVVATEFLHNEYRRSFVEFHYRFCDLVNKEPWIGGMLKQSGAVCPAPKGLWRVMNMTVPSHDFPNVWPFEKGGVDINVTVTDTGETIIAGYVHCTFKQPRKKL